MSMIFLAVQDSSIGDLVTHWFPDWLLNSASSQSRAHTRCSLHPGTRLRFVMRSEFLTRMTRVTLRWEKWGTCRQWHCYQWNNDGKGFSYNEKNDKHEDNDIANDEIRMTRVSLRWKKWRKWIMKTMILLILKWGWGFLTLHWAKTQKTWRLRSRSKQFSENLRITKHMTIVDVIKYCAGRRVERYHDKDGREIHGSTSERNGKILMLIWSISIKSWMLIM